MKNTLQLNQIINIQAYKHDGKLYRQWNGAKVIEVSPEAYVLLLYKTKVAESNGQKWVVREPTIWFMPRDRFFNSFCLIRNSGLFFYTNLASPPFLEDDAIKFIDYDLDIKLHPGKTAKIVDVKEYEFHKKKYKYPVKLMKKIEETMNEVLELIKNEEGFFDEDVIDTYIKELVDSKDLAKKFLKTRTE